MKKFLVIESANWADEFDIEGFKIFEANSDEDIKSVILKGVNPDGKWPKEFYFGTNECIDINDEKEFFDNLYIKEISESEYNMLVNLFGETVKTYSFGTTAII